MKIFLNIVCIILAYIGALILGIFIAAFVWKYILPIAYNWINK